MQSFLQFLSIKSRYLGLLQYCWNLKWHLSVSWQPEKIVSIVKNNLHFCLVTNFDRYIITITFISMCYTFTSYLNKNEHFTYQSTDFGINIFFVRWLVCSSLNNGLLYLFACLSIFWNLTKTWQTDESGTEKKWHLNFGNTIEKTLWVYLPLR